MAEEPLPRFKDEPLPTANVPFGTSLYRSHRLANSALFFGKAKSFRFDDALGLFGVLYAAKESFGAFAETFLRYPVPPLLSRSDLDSRGCAVISVARDLKIVPLHSHYLVALGATAEVTHGSAANYHLPQSWSRAIYEHPANYDGIEYRSRHDDSQLCYAIFDRADTALSAVMSTSAWTADAIRLGEILDRYDVGIAYP